MFEVLLAYNELNLSCTSITAMQWILKIGLQFNNSVLSFIRQFVSASICFRELNYGYFF